MKWSELVEGDIIERTHVWLVLRVDTIDDRLVKLTFCMLDEGSVKEATFLIDKDFSKDYILRLVERT